MDNLRGILLMVASMACFAIEDAFLKAAAAGLPLGQLIFVNCVAGMLVFGTLARLQGRALFARGAWGGMALLRNTSEILSSFSYITALALIPLSLASAILQASPILMTLFAALFLGEMVGWRRWCAVAAGMAGVLVILRPGTEAFQPEAIWAVVSVLALTVRELATRRVSPEVGGMQIAFSACAMLTGLGAVMMAFEGGPVMPDAAEAGLLLGVVASGTLGYGAVIAAARTGEIAVVTPFRYSRLLFALVIGAVVFAERPDALTLLGAGLIIASGLYTLARERKRRKMLAQIAVPTTSLAPPVRLDKP
ncbi:DMT family transporter [Frigidibacter sp. MR17.14]|uniref:DMT family transporter n=1 Tax=Frigidibacter sp. MR17.14 TaxID=3126509 RepID=UPI003012CC00